MKKIVGLIACLCVIIFMSMSYISQDKEYEDIYLNSTLNSIADCVSVAKKLMISNTEPVFLSDISIRYTDIHDENATEILITFIQINKNALWKPYTVYAVTINPKTHEAYNISKKHCEYVIYDDLQIQDWKLDLDNAIDNDSIKKIMETYDIKGTVVISTSNFDWKYQFSDGENNINIAINPVTMDIIN